MTDSIPDPGLLTWVESKLGDKAPQWLCNQIAMQLQEHFEDMEIQYGDEWEEAKRR